MSRWAGLEARFFGDPKYVTAEAIMRDVPTGSESGPSAWKDEDGEVFVDGRLRDVTDLDSPSMLAWFIRACDMFVREATLTIDIDSGPRYRYEYREGTVVKLKGILD